MEYRVIVPECKDRKSYGHVIRFCEKSAYGLSLVTAFSIKL